MRHLHAMTGVELETCYRL